VVAHVVEPDFWVFEREQDVRPGEGFVVSRIAVGLEASVDESALFLGDKAALRGPVRNVEIACCCEYNGDDTLL